MYSKNRNVTQQDKEQLLQSYNECIDWLLEMAWIGINPRDERENAYLVDVYNNLDKYCPEHKWEIICARHHLNLMRGSNIKTRFEIIAFMQAMCMEDSDIAVTIGII